MTRSVTVKDTSGIRWQVNAAYTSFFIASPAPDPRRLLRNKMGDIIKKSPVRVIFASSLSDENRELPVVIKIYRLAKVGDWIKANLLGSKARKEWRITTTAAERGLNTVIPVAYGERRRGGMLRESYLMTVRLFHCITLEEALFSTDGELHADKRTRREIIALLAALLREMHDNGIYHQDLHPGNFLVEKEAAGKRSIYLLDLHRASVCRSLSLKKRIDSLTQFNMFATIAHSNSERLLFFNSYFGKDKPWQKDKRRLIEAINRKTLKGRWRLWRSRQTRCVNSNKYFMRLSFAGLRGFARRGEWKGEMAALLLESPSLRGDGMLLKESRSKEIWERRVALHGEEKTLIVKHYKKKRGWKAFRYIFRSSQSLRSWKGAFALSIRNLKTVRSIAALEKRLPFHRLGDAYFIAEKIPGVENLIAYAAGNSGDIRPLATALALFMRRVHQRGIYHGDMKATNVLVRKNSDGTFTFFLTDLDHVGAKLGLSRREVVRNFFQLNKSFLDLSLVSFRDRLFFLARYLGPYRRAELRPLWKKIARMTKRHFKASGNKFHYSAKKEIF